jgi:hypothetical protein
MIGIPPASIPHKVNLKKDCSVGILSITKKLHSDNFEAAALKKLGDDTMSDDDGDFDDTPEMEKETQITI